jgi:NAD(P)-dependent dehydrogenase (short-subunit alcohol dehydrogenase family)
VLCPGIIKTDIARKAAEREPFEGTQRSEAQTFVNGILVDTVQRGIDPSEVAERVLDAIRDEQFLILTHDHHADAITDRAESLANLELPPIVDYT